MKITQNLLLLDQYYSTTASSYLDILNRLHFEPSLYSGIDKIYFEVTARVTNVDTTGKVCIYNETTGEMIEGTEMDIDSTDWVRIRSADLSAILTSEMPLSVRIKRTAGSNYVDVVTAKLIVQQTAVGTARKTVTKVPFFAYYAEDMGFYNDGWFAQRVKLQKSNYDGVVSYKVECYLGRIVGGTAYARLYDVTADEVVPGTEFSTTGAPYTLFESSELTDLDESHQYEFQFKGNYGSPAFCAGACLKIVQSSFEKTAAIALICGCGQDVDPTNTWADQVGYGLFEPDYIDGDTLSFAFYTEWIYYDYSEGTFHGRMYDKTGDAVIPGTEHTFTYDTLTAGAVQDSYTPSESAAEIVGQKDEGGAHCFNPTLLYAFQYEALAFPPSLPADPSKPTGYHCFMSQFIKNCLNGTVPLKTPDGVNKCW